jgi:hypothetical protein
LFLPGNGLAKEKVKIQNISENSGVSQSTPSLIMHIFIENQEKYGPEVRIVLRKYYFDAIKDFWN